MKCSFPLPSLRGTRVEGERERGRGSGSNVGYFSQAMPFARGHLIE